MAYGASLADLLYTFVAVYAFSSLYSYYQPYIPYFLLIGSVFLVILGYRTTKRKLDFEQPDNAQLLTAKHNNRGGFRTGLVVNFLNPALFVGWLIASFLAITVVSSMGYNTGGLSAQMNHTIHDIENSNINKQLEEKKDALEHVIGKIENQGKPADSPGTKSGNGTTRLILSWLFAAAVAAGSTIWFYFLGTLVVKWRKIFNPNTINRLILALGYLLMLLGIFFFASSLKDLLA